MSDSTTKVFVPISDVYPDLPAGVLDMLPDEQGNSLVDRVGVSGFSMQQDESELVMRVELEILGEVAVGIPGADAISLALGDSTQSSVLFRVEIVIGNKPRLRILDLEPRLGLSTDFFKPVTRHGGSGPFMADLTRKPEIPLGVYDLEIDPEGGIALSPRTGAAATFELRPVALGDTGLVLEASGISIFLDPGNPPPGKPAGWRGCLLESAIVYLPESISSGDDLISISLSSASIGSNGISGVASVNWTANYDPLAKKITGDLVGQLGGFAFALQSVSISLLSNALTEASIQGLVQIPYFEQALQVELGLTASGGLTMGISSNQPASLGTTYCPDGLFSFDKSDVLQICVQSIGLTLENGLFTTKLSGQVKPLFGAPTLDWPSFHVNELAIDSKGNVHLDGGWLNLPSQYALNFHAFQFEITKLGFGKTEDGGKWIGFSGGIKLVDGLKAGASVEGLRIIWYDNDPTKKPSITFNGVGVEFQVPEVLKFKGAVAYNTIQDGARTIHRFDGEIKLTLISLNNMEIDATLVFGSESDPQGNTYTFFAIYLGVELPAGIPLWSTGLALYGMAGLFATQMEPNKGALPNLLHPTSHVDEGWYESPDGISPGWYKRGTPGVTDLKTKWDPRQGSLAFGVGATIGTVPDNGTSFHGKFLLVIVFPGPIILLEGRGDLLKKRALLDKPGVTTIVEEPLFRALAVLDNRVGTFTIGLDAQYKYKQDGELIDIHGGAEAFFDFHDAQAWHIYLGRNDPSEKRIRAEIFEKLFEANAYFMLVGKNPYLQMGAWVGFAKGWNFGPLAVNVEAFIQGDAVVSRKPAHFHGDLQLHGSAKVGAFGFGFVLSVDAHCAADVFDPFHLLFDFHVSVDLPWPLPDFKVDISLEWGPYPVPPPLPLPLKEIAIEHLKVTTSWPLPRGTLLLPNYDNDDFRQVPDTDPAVVASASPPALVSVPVVPLDSRPHITFGRAVNDDALVGVNVQSEVWERIGDTDHNQGPVKVRYSLQELALHRWIEGTKTWDIVAQSPGSAAKTKLYGSWAPVPTLSGGGANVDQVKLWLWSKNPFDYSRHSGRAWDEWFTSQFPNYPCVPPAPDREICCELAGIDTNTLSPPTWQCPDHPEIGLSWLAPDGSFHSDEVTITLPPGTKGVKITPHQEHGEEQVGHARRCIDFEHYPPGPGSNPRTEREVEFEARIPHPIFGNPVLAPQTRVMDLHSITGLDCGYELEIHLPRPCFRVEVTLTSDAGQPLVQAFKEDGSIANPPVQVAHGHLFLFTFEDNAIARVLIHAGGEAVLQQLCFEYLVVTATGTDGRGTIYSSSTTDQGTIEISGNNITSVQVHGEGTVQVDEVCVILDPDPAEVIRREEKVKHLVDELAHWSQQGDVLEPDTIYRLQVVTRIEAQGEGELAGYSNDLTQTEYAYFRTEGPPGVTKLLAPAGHPTPDTFESGLDDLTHYVRQTVPATVPPEGQPPPLPGPVYRAYDVGVEFNEDYVDLMYRIARRDLGLYLYNSNNQPVRDAQGRLIVLSNRWGSAEELTLTESEDRWITVVNDCTNGKLDEQKIPHSKTLTSAVEGQVLDADTIYEARLVPLLLHEDFTQDLAGWKVLDEATPTSNWLVRGHKTLAGQTATISGAMVKLGDSPDLSKVMPIFDTIVLEKDTARSSRQYRIVSVDDAAKTVGVDGAPNLAGGPSPWRIPTLGAVVQTSAIWGGTSDGRDPVKPGTMLLRGDPNWTNYRLSAFLRATTGDGAMGIVFRHPEPKTYYRFSMDRARTYRRLVRVVSGTHTILAEDDFVYRQNVDYLITVEAIGTSLRVYQDGALVFAVTDSAINGGSIGLYSWNNAGVRFSDVRLDDFRTGAPIAYSFKFTTSQFTNFFHHLHSYQDETWLKGADADISALLSQAVDPATIPPSDAEYRAYEALAKQVLKQEAYQNPPEVQVRRVTYNNQDLAFLVQGPEPIDWKRTDLEVSYADRWVPAPQLPGAVKLTDVIFGKQSPNEESVTLLLREATNLRGHRLEQRLLPGPLTESGGPPALFMDEFNGADSGVLFREEFGPNVLDHYTIVDEEPPGSFPSNWEVANGRIEQRGDYRGGPPAGDPLPARPGTIALLSSGDWSNASLSATLRTDSQRDIGLVFRYQDSDNYYRLSLARQDALLNASFRRLIKKVDGTVTVLWQDSIGHDTTQPIHLVIESFGDRLVGYLDNALLFSLRDPDISTGRVGLYCWGNNRAYFEALQVESLESDPVLWQPSFADMSDVVVIDDAGAIGGPSNWSATNGMLTQSSSIQGEDAAWQQQPGSAHDIAVGADGSVWCTFMAAPRAYSLYRWNGSDWDSIADSAIGGVRIAVDPAGLPWVVDDAQQIFRWDGNGFQRLQGSAYDIAVGPGTPTYIVGTPARRGGVGIYYGDGRSWQMLHSGALGMTVGSASRIAVAPDNSPWVVNEAQQIFRWDGSSWQQMPGTASDIGIGADGSAWIIGTTAVSGGYAISRWDGIAWEMIEGGALGIAVGPDGNPWVVNDAQQVSRWIGNTSRKRGTYTLGGSSAWRDVQLSVRLHSDAGGAIGVMFRYLDADNYYRFSMDRLGNYRRLTKAVGGTLSVLWEDQVQYVQGQSYELTIRTSGGWLSGYLDGTLLFTVYDADIKQGRVGLYCRANPGAHFERVLVKDYTRQVGKWTIRDEVQTGEPSQWRLARGELVQMSSIKGGEAPDLPGTEVVAGDPAWKNYRLAVSMRSDTDGAIGMIFRYMDDDNYYRLSVDAGRKYRRLTRKVGGVFTSIWEDAGSFTVSESFTLTVDAVGARLVGHMDDELLFSVTDNTHTAGQVGLYCWGNTAACFERVEVRRPSLEASALLRDRFNDNDISDWTSEDEGTQDLPSNWTTFKGLLRQTSNIYTPLSPRDPFSMLGTQIVVGDPTWTNVVIRANLESPTGSAIGVLFRHSDMDNYYRFSMDSLQGYRRLVKKVNEKFTLLWEDNIAYEVGRSHEFIVVAVGSLLRGFMNGIPMFTVEDTSLTAGQVGLYCWANKDARFSQVRVYPLEQAFNDWLLDEPFEFLIPGRWTFVDEGDLDGPSQWVVAGGKMRQMSNIHRGHRAPNEPDKPGTHALVGDAAWTDYRLTAQLSSDNTAGAIGVLFRYQDKDNCYRFSMDHQGSYRRLVKKTAGAVTVLWEDAIQYVVGREYVLTIDCVGERLTGYLDGILLFICEDDAHSAGQVGLYCWENTGASFSEVRVAEPVWLTYYAFGKEERLPSGTRVRVHAGNLKNAPLEEQGVVQRFIASLGELGQLRLLSDGTDLRLLMGGMVGHMRRFLPDSDYKSVNARVLRKADGTAFLIAAQSGSKLTAGQYRLKMVYHRRANQTADPTSQVFSEAGNSDREVVTLDIPWWAH